MAAEFTPDQISYKYANEADLLNVALFGMTAKQWREKNSGKTVKMPATRRKRLCVPRGSKIFMTDTIVYGVSAIIL